MWTWFDPRLDTTWQLSLLVLYSTLKDFLWTAPILFRGPNSTFHFICSLLKSRALNKARLEWLLLVVVVVVVEVVVVVVVVAAAAAAAAAVVVVVVVVVIQSS